MTKNQIIGTIIAALLILIFFIVNPFGWNKETAAPCPQLKTTGIIGAIISSDSLIHMHEKLAALKAEKAIQEKLTLCDSKGNALRAENAKLKAENAKLKSADKKLRREIDALKKKLKSTKTVAPVISQGNNISSSNVAPSSASSQSTNTKIATNSYTGIVTGDAGCTFDVNSNLFFYVKTSLLNSIRNRTQNWSNLNSESGPKGEEVGAYTYYKTPVLILIDMLDKEWGWTTYVGNNSKYGYDMWLWHELTKLSPSLTSLPEVQGNGIGGYQYISKVNYHSK